MSYAAAVEHLYALSGELMPPTAGSPRRKFELEHMRILAEALGNPQMTFPCVLIAGTNGKGSTAATLASILNVAGYCTGLYTSPHLLRVNERIQMGAPNVFRNALTEIDDDMFARLYFRVDDAATKLVSEGALPHPPSFFEVLTAVAFLAFAETHVDIAVLEVGLGGRLDATNIADPLLSIVTDIALDHMEWLGDTLTAIAREKAGILRPNGILVTLPQHPEANAALGEIAVSLNVTGVNAAAYLPDRAVGLDAYTLTLDGQSLLVASTLAGEHQHRNVALAIAAAVQLHKNERFTGTSLSAIQEGIRQTRWPGRLERLPLANGGTMLLDVAHNPAGVWALRSYLSRSMENGSLPSPRVLVFSALRDKSILEMAQILFPLFEGHGDRILLAPVNSPRGASIQELATVARELQAPVSAFDTVAEAMNATIEGAGSVVVSGSVYLVGEAKAWFARSRA